MTETTTTTATISRTYRSRKLAAAVAVAVAAALAAVGVTATTGGAATATAPPARIHRAASTTGTVGGGAGLGAAFADDGDLDVFHRAGETSNGSGTGSWSSMYDFMETVLLDADTYWTSVLTAAGMPEPWVNYQLPAPGETVGTQCNPGTSDDDSMFYCSADDMIVFSQSIATRLWDGSFVGPDGQVINAPGGDFAVAYLLGHEFGHSIQAEVGIFAMGFSVPQLEKHADCWSGVWARSASDRGLLDEGDTWEGLAGAFVAGDSQLESAGHHGTPDERMQAFALGFNSGIPSTCDAYLQ